MIQKRICKQCSVTFQGGPRAYYCPSCRIARQREQDRNFKARKRKGDYRALGSTDKCERCGKEYTVTASLQRFCTDCQLPHAIEYDRVTTLEFYVAKKYLINPVRNERRRKGAKICQWCGKEFKASTVTTACSPECKRELKNKWWRERYHRIKKEVKNDKA